MNSYGTLKLIEHSPQASLIEPLTLTEARTFLQLPELSPADDADDALIESVIVAAREVAEVHQNRDLILKRQRLSLDCFPCEQIELRAPLVSVELVRYRNSDGDWTTLTEGTDYIVDTEKEPGIVMPAYGVSWPSFTPWPTGAVQIEFISGYEGTDIFWGSSGQRVLQGMKMLISHWWNNRVPVEAGVVFGELPHTITSLLSTGALRRVA